MTFRARFGLGFLVFGLMMLSSFAVGQGLPPYQSPNPAPYPAQGQYPPQAQYPPPAQYPAPAPYPQAGQVSAEMLGTGLRSAAAFHELVRGLNLATALGPDQHLVGADGRLHHPMIRTVEVMGAGAGVGAAIGEMTHKPNGVMVGALVGGIGGLIIDQVMRQREEARMRAAYGPDRDGREFRDRDHDGREFHDGRQLQTR
jgi:hypothetical protein